MRRLSFARPREPRAIVDPRSNLLRASSSSKPARCAQVAWALYGSDCPRGRPLPDTDCQDPALLLVGFRPGVLSRSLEPRTPKPADPTTLAEWDSGFHPLG